jgi:NAD(P)-dependent dehydrogenase (short-subunit alcohol dehydrogenase family)
MPDTLHRRRSVVDTNVNWSLDGKVAIITGAARGGIGATYALTLAAAGATVVCADVRRDPAEAVAEEIRSAGGRAAAFEVDISDEVSVERLVSEVVEQFGGVDVLVNNAALMAQIVSTPAVGVTRAQWDTAFAVNVTGAWQLSKAVIPSMVSRGGGRIVNVTSAGAFPAESLYGITKVAVVGLTTTLARELGKQGITVNAIAPGIVASDAGKSLTPEGSDYREMLEARAATRAVGEPTDLAGALLLLTSPAGSWISGQVLHVDGGFIMRP